MKKNFIQQVTRFSAKVQTSSHQSFWKTGFIVLPWVSNYFPPRSLTCQTKIFMKEIFVHRGTCPTNLPETTGGGSNLTPTVSLEISVTS